MIFQIENKNVHASDAGQGIDSKKDTIIFLHGSGLSHIVWSLAEQFFSNLILLIHFITNQQFFQLYPNKDHLNCHDQVNQVIKH